VAGCSEYNSREKLYMKYAFVKIPAIILACVMVIAEFSEHDISSIKKKAINYSRSGTEAQNYSGTDTEAQNYSESETEVAYSEPEYVLSRQDAKFETSLLAMDVLRKMKSDGSIASYSFYLSDITETEATIKVDTQIHIWSYQHGGNPDTCWNAIAIFEKYTGECISFNIV